MTRCTHCGAPVAKDANSTSGFTHVDERDGDHAECWYGHDHIDNGTTYAKHVWPPSPVGNRTDWSGR